MARKLAVLVLVALCGLAFWLRRDSAPAALPLAAPESEHAAPQPAKPESAPAERREEAPASAATAPAPASALVVVICRAKESGAPLAGQQIDLFSERAAGIVPEGNGTHGKLGELLHTSADGRVEYEVPPGIALHLQTNPDSFAANASASRELAPLAPGERREVVLELATREDSRFCARVVARETKLPIAAAEVRGAARELATDADGRFELPFSTWSRLPLAIVARDYAECDVHAQAGHETPETALVLELERSCTLVGLLKDGGAGKCVLVAATEGYRLQEQDPGRMSFQGFDAGDRTWRADFDATGRAEIAGLPPNAPLRVKVTEGKKTLVELGERVTIPPGATREFALHASSTCALVGRVRDREGKPVAELTLWLLRADSSLRLYLQRYEERELLGRTKTDAEGRFRIEKVSPGQWRLGPEPHLHIPPAPVGADEVAPLAQLVEIAAGETQHELELVVDRGLSIRGRVLDPEGKPVAQAGVLGFANSLYVDVNTGADGSFELGPLPAGSFTLQAESFGSGCASSENVRADAGAREVVLQLRKGAKLAGRVVDGASGAGALAAIAVSIPADPLAPIHMPTSSADGAFALDGLLPGTYALVATTDDGRVGILRGVELPAGGDLHELVIALQPAARVRVHYTGQREFCNVQVELDGVVVATDGIEKGTTKNFAAPVGRSRLVCRLFDPEKRIVRPLELAAGELREVEIGDEE